MTVKKIGMTVLFAMVTFSMVFMAMAVPSADAAVSVDKVDLVYVGTNDNGGATARYYFRLQNNTGSAKCGGSWATGAAGERGFFLSDTLGDSGLATLLTAFSLGTKLFATFESNTCANASVVSTIYLAK